MILSDKFRLKEDQYQLHLEMMSEGGKRIPGGGVSKPGWQLQGYYPKTSDGRVQVYNRIINLGVTELEEQSLKEILRLVEETSAQIIDWYEGQSHVV